MPAVVRFHFPPSFFEMAAASDGFACGALLMQSSSFLLLIRVSPWLAAHEKLGGCYVERPHGQRDEEENSRPGRQPLAHAVGACLHGLDRSLEESWQSPPQRNFGNSYRAAIGRARRFLASRLVRQQHA